MASILLSEADPDVRRLLVAFLERLGHEAIVLEAGVAAPPPADLMLLEPAVPERLEQAREIRGRQPSLPVVCLSVLPAEARFLSLGPLGYLTKPFTAAELDDVIEAALASTVADSSYCLS
jgi:DNA-binding response OmpR family regulator